MSAIGVQSWDVVERLVDHAGSLKDLEVHGLLPFAARRARAGVATPSPVLRQLERAAAAALVAAPYVLARIRQACQGPIVLIKGYEVAQYYPDPRLRPFTDIDVLVPDSAAVQQALLDAGFRPLGAAEAFVGVHHLQPLALPGIALTVEVHHEPKWPSWVKPPSSEELFALTGPSRAGLDGILTLPPAAHALLLVAHGWAHEPLHTIRSLLDAVVVASAAEPGEVEALARRWGMERMWSTTSACAGSLLGQRKRTWAERLWARHLGATRDRTLFEHHVQKWLAPLWGTPFPRSLAVAGAAIGRDLLPRRGETWSRKLARVGTALRRRSMRSSEYNQETLMRRETP